MAAIRADNMLMEGYGHPVITHYAVDLQITVDQLTGYNAPMIQQSFTERIDRDVARFAAATFLRNLRQPSRRSSGSGQLRTTHFFDSEKQ